MTGKDKELLGMCEGYIKHTAFRRRVGLLIPTDETIEQLATELKRRIEQLSERELALVKACEWPRDNPDSPISARENILRILAAYGKEEGK